MSANYLIPRPSIVNDDVRCIDYVACRMSHESRNQWLKWVHSLNLTGELKEPKVTVCYSSTRVNWFPIDTLQGEFDEYVKEPVVITPGETDMKFNLFTDPWGITHLVLEIDHPVFLTMFNYFKKRGANWEYGEYHSHVVIESNTLKSLECLDGLCLPPFCLTFDHVTYSRFGELLSPPTP